MADETLCSSCQKIPLHSLFYGQYDPKNRSIFFGRLKKIFSKENCRLCRFIRDVLVDHYRKDYVERKLGAGHDQNIWLYQNAIDLHFDEDAKRSKVKKPFYLQVGCISVVSREGSHFRREDMRNDDELTRDWVMPSIFALKHLPQEESGLRAGKSLEKTFPDHRGRLVDCRKIDWGLINQWDSACSHHAGLTPERELNPNLRSNFRDRLRVIDIEQACVIACPPNASYVALSYQWGSDQKLKLKKANISMLETPGYFSTLEGEPARTIRDSMIVVKRLGYRYLWVDALCIVQDDTENVIMNVDQMDQIYQGAHLTVVAAAGKDAYHGLPGVTPETPRSEEQLRVMIKGTWISSMLESGEGAINFSRWITRAWTYQERLLSSRILSFTKSQVFFSCNQGCDFQEQYQFARMEDATYTVPDLTARFDFEYRDLWEIYASSVAAYTRRSMSDPSDKLRAFNGVLNYLENPFGAAFWFGLPANLFDVALLWKPRRSCRRTDLGFPSWSWAGWDCTVVYNPSDSMNNVCECVISQANITIPGKEFFLTSCIKTNPGIPHGWQRCFDNEELSIQYRSSDPEFSFYRYPRPMPRMSKAEKDLLSSHKSPVLKVAAKTARFLLTEQHSRLRDALEFQKPRCTEDSHELCYLAILDGQNREAGTIIVNGDLRPRLANKMHRFLGLSRSTLHRVDDPSWDSERNVFRPWTEQQGTKVQKKLRRLDQPNKILMLEDAELEEGYAEANESFFDQKYFSDQVFWPAVNVLLLSEEKDGVVERLGIGQIHVDAFEPIAQQEELLLG